MYGSLQVTFYTSTKTDGSLIQGIIIDTLLKLSYSTLLKEFSLYNCAKLEFLLLKLSSDKTLRLTLLLNGFSRKFFIFGTCFFHMAC